MLFIFWFVAMLSAALAFVDFELGIVEDMVKMQGRTTAVGATECSEARHSEGIFQQVCAARGRHRHRAAITYQLRKYDGGGCEGDHGARPDRVFDQDGD